MVQVIPISIFAVEKYDNVNVLIVTLTNQNINPLNNLLGKNRGIIHLGKSETKIIFP